MAYEIILELTQRPLNYTRGKGFYEMGMKYCAKCVKFCYSNERQCFRCGNHLRTKPHSSSGRRRRLKMHPPARY